MQNSGSNWQWQWQLNGQVTLTHLQKLRLHFWSYVQQSHTDITTFLPHKSLQYSKSRLFLTPPKQFKVHSEAFYRNIHQIRLYSPTWRNAWQHQHGKASITFEFRTYEVISQSCCVYPFRLANQWPSLIVNKQTLRVGSHDTSQIKMEMMGMHVSLFCVFVVCVK